MEEKDKTQIAISSSYALVILSLTFFFENILMELDTKITGSPSL